MRTSVTYLEDNMVQLTIEVEDDQISAVVEETLNKLTQSATIKGFRKGKAPRRLVEQKMGGPAAVRAESIRDSIADFYAMAVAQANVDPIDQPAVTISDGDESGTLVLEALVAVRPEPGLPGYRELRVTIPSPFVGDDEIDEQTTRIRMTDAVLEDVDRPILMGDIAVVDVNGTDPNGEEEAVQFDDYSFLIGSGSIAEGIDETIIGMRSGETLEAMGRSGHNKYMAYSIVIKQVRERVLPELTDEWAKENTESDTVVQWRESIQDQLQKRRLMESQFARRDATLVAVSDLIESSVVPPPLVNREIQSRLQDLSERLNQQGMTVESFLKLTGQEPQQIVDVLQVESERAVRIDLALRSLAREESLAATDEEIEKELAETAQSMGAEVEVLRENLRTNGRIAAFAAEIAKLKASRWLMDNVIYVDDTGAEIDRTLLETVQSDASPE